MDDLPSSGWWQQYQGRRNADREMTLVGQRFTDAFSLVCGESRFVLRMGIRRTNTGLCKVVLLTRNYDYSCTPVYLPNAFHRVVA